MKGNGPEGPFVSELTSDEYYKGSDECQQAPDEHHDRIMQYIRDLHCKIADINGTHIPCTGCHEYLKKLLVIYKDVRT